MNDHVDIVLTQCRICGSPNATLRGWGGIECHECHSTMAEPMPSPEELAEFYSHYNSTYIGGGNSEGRNQIRYANKYLKLVQSLRQGGTIIDVGCANNPFPNIATHHGYQVTAADYSMPCGLDEKVRFIEGNLNSTDILHRASQYDIVTSWAVIEHTVDPDRSFEILSRLTNTNGWVILTTPEAGTYLTKHSAGKTRWFYPPEHLHLISPGAIEILAAKHNMELISHGRLELSLARSIARYGVGLVETILGGLLKIIWRSRWHKLRQSKHSRFIGIKWYILRKTS